MFVKKYSNAKRITAQPYLLVKKEETTKIHIEYMGTKLEEPISFVFGYEDLLGKRYEFQCHYDHSNFIREDFFANRIDPRSLEPFFQEEQSND